MLPDDLIDGVLSGGYLPGIHSITLTDARGGGAVVLDARREDPDKDIVAQLGPARAGTGSRVFFIWRDQTGFVRPHPQWQIADSFDATNWIADTVDDAVQQRAVAVTCKRKPT